MTATRLATGTLGAALSFALFSCSADKSTQSAKPEIEFMTSVDPSSGQGDEAVLTARFSPPVGRTLREARVLLNSGLDGRFACYVYYLKPDNAFRLVEDTGSGSTGIAVGAASSLENSQCSLDGTHSSAQMDGNVVLLSLALKFKLPWFHGNKKIYLYAEAADGSNSGIQPKGSWTVTSGTAK